MRATRFTHPDAVDAWDHWFRWRDGAQLRDRTIDATWARVAAAVAPAGAAHARWVQRYMDAFCHWQVMPDERLLARAGTGIATGGMDAPVAVLNLAAFVTAGGAGRTQFHEQHFLDACTLAVRLLDDALLMTGLKPERTALHIGVLGFADALAQLGIAYGDRLAVEFADHVGRLLDTGTLQGTLDLACERGGQRPAKARLLQWQARGSRPDLVAAIAERGQRHRALTAIACHPRLAQLANASSPGIEPRARAARNGARTAPREAIRVALASWLDAPIADAGDAAV